MPMTKILKISYFNEDPSILTEIPGDQFCARRRAKIVEEVAAGNCSLRYLPIVDQGAALVMSHRFFKDQASAESFATFMQDLADEFGKSISVEIQDQTDAPYSIADFAEDIVHDNGKFFERGNPSAEILPTDTNQFLARLAQEGKI